ncbi:BgTH12-01779 [Blumeria graminis f. sp. triticale]|uniref:Bgt-1838 n=3 Tax=Blumeria graminis TaxID=34373 RepID=A0A381LKN5_BLUGR|nr:hypothetical protein BGT96224_1838 [Blumeria graminis f. sp. tritici 96224]CAD6501527.1 BgTH12-01779 [Blumeria graminis f. sp. triticale]VDB84074.1 Bgt-1838 [Blumeria graminis f. sp. tritici]
MYHVMKSPMLRSIKLPKSTCLRRLGQSIATPQQWRSIFASKRELMRIGAQNQNQESPNLHRVMFKKRRKGLFDVFIFMGTVYACSLAYNHFVLQPLDRALEDTELPELPEEELPPLFLPFPMTVQEVKQAPYRGSDPEWQEFINFSQQPDLAQQVCHNLANLILKAVDKHPILSLHLGQEMKLRRYWLDVDFPLDPPPEYTQSGIEIGSDYIAWTTHPVDSMTVRKLQRALWPSIMTLSSISFFKVVVADFVDQISGIFGFKPKPPPSLEQILARHRQFIKGTKVPPTEGPPAGAQLFPLEDDVSEAKTIGFTSLNAGSKDNESDVKIDEALVELRQQFSGPLVAFKRTFSRFWKRPICHPPRGCITVSGLVEVDTAKAYLVLDVIAYWNPQLRSIDMESLTVGVRRIQLKKQSPRGDD